MRTDHGPMDAVLDALATSRPDPARPRTTRRATPFVGAEPVHRTAPVDPLPAPAPLPETLRRRRSTLRYAAEPVSTVDVLDVVTEALAQDRATWDLDDDAGPLEAFVFALRSTDLAPGVYRVANGERTAIAPLSALGPVEDLGIQREFSTAAGIVATYAPLDRAEDWSGAHGYRVSATRAAMVTYDLSLQCIARGLVGTVFGGFIPSAVRTIVQGDGVTRHPLLAATYARSA